MKRYGFFLILLALCCITPARALEVSAHSAILMDADTGQVLYEKNPKEKSLIASTTKIMTALVVLEQGNLTDVVEIPQAATGIEGSSMYLKAGEQVTVEELLYGMMLSSGNDAAVALALHTAGSIEEFAKRMNQQAERLNLTDSHFANPNGLDSQENYATAYDLAQLTRAAMETPGFLEIVSTKSCQCAGRYLVNHNKLLWQYDGSLGVKTGYTKQAGRILVGAAERNGRRLVSVTIHAPNDWQDHKAMLDYGFSQYAPTTMIAAGQTVGSLPVISGTMEQLPVTAEASVTAYLLPGEQPELRLYLPMFRYAPVETGERLGVLELFLGGKKLGQTPVLAGASAAQNPAPRKGA